MPALRGAEDGISQMNAWDYIEMAGCASIAAFLILVEYLMLEVLRTGVIP